MPQPTELRTQRLLLRSFRLTDIDDVRAYGDDAQWAEYGPRPYTRDDAIEVVTTAILKSWDKEAVFAIVLDGRVVGLVSLTIDAANRSAELGYEIARRAWGRGLATEAASAVCDWGFREYGLGRIFAEADAENRRSWRVMEKLGMTREGNLRAAEILRGKRTDTLCYGVLREEWRLASAPLPPTPAPTIVGSERDRFEAPRLKTERLVLRAFEPDDVDDVYDYARDPDWAAYLRPSVPEPYARLDAERFVAAQLGDASDANVAWAIELGGRVIGSLGIRIESRHNVGEMGYAIARSHWGRGLMPEAADAAIRWGFERRKLSKLFAEADAENRRSWRVMEKLGMTREGVQRSHRSSPDAGRPRVDFVRYGLLREEWEALGAQA